MSHSSCRETKISPHRESETESVYVHPKGQHYLSYFLYLLVYKWRKQVFTCTTSVVISCLLNLYIIIWAETPATQSIRLSGHQDISWMANGSSSTISALGLSSLQRTFSNTLAVFSLYSTWSITEHYGKQNMTDSVCETPNDRLAAYDYFCTLINKCAWNIDEKWFYYLNTRETAAKDIKLCGKCVARDNGQLYNLADSLHKHTSPHNAMTDPSESNIPESCEIKCYN